jgi:hypothetical protein
MNQPQAHNLRRWEQSGFPQKWVEDHRGQWNHSDWLALLEELKRTEFWPMEPNAIGNVLEAKKSTRTTESLGFAIDLNNQAIELRKIRRFDEAAVLLRRAISIEDRLLPPGHPKRAHRRNNLAIICLLANQLDEAGRINAEAWALKSGQHDLTSGRILFARIAINWLQKADATCCLGQLKTLLEQPQIPCLGDVNPQWETGDILNCLRPRLAPAQADLLVGIVAALNEQAKVADLERFPLWKLSLALSLTLSWENYESANIFAKIKSSAPYSRGSSDQGMLSRGR